MTDRTLTHRTLAARCTALLAALLALTSCSTITEDLPLCESYVQFRYDLNMLSVDAFPTQVRRIHLYVFDEADRFVTLLTDEREAFGTDYRLALPQLPDGTYRLIAWAGLYDRSYQFPANLRPGVSTTADLSVQMHRAADGSSSSRLDALWHGQHRLHLSSGVSTTATIGLTKDTNRLRIVVQGAEGMDLRAADLRFTLTDTNARLGFDNALLPGGDVTYHPYFTDEADLSTRAGGLSAVVAELNTLRLMDGAPARLLVTHSSGETLVDIDLIRYLLLTKMEGHDMPAQEYLDRQDEYALIFFLSKDALGHYLLMYVKINGWTIRPQQGDF